jgi:hypothetical protein
MPVYLYIKDHDYNNHFLSIWDSLVKVKPFVDQIDWMEVHRLACQPKKKAPKSVIKKKCQDPYEDTRFYSLANK